MLSRADAPTLSVLLAARPQAEEIPAVLGDFLNRARGDLTELVSKIRSATETLSTDERLPAIPPPAAAPADRHDPPGDLVF
jgi:hypothetical protein